MRITFRDEADLHAHILRDIVQANYSGVVTIEAYIEPKHTKNSRVMTGADDKRVPFAVLFPKGYRDYQRVHAQIGPSYEDVVQKRRVALGIVAPDAPKFVAQSLPWGQWEAAPWLITHTPKSTGVFGWYLRYYLDMTANSKYDQHIAVDERGNLLSSAQADLFYAEYAEEKRPSGTQNLPPEAEVQPRTMMLANIQRLVAAGNEYVREGYLHG